MNHYIYIFIGGGLGAMLRFGLSSWLNNGPQIAKFPIGVLACNILGCFVIGLLFAWQKEHQPQWLSPLLITGLLGGFTTFSSFGLETHKLFDSGAFLTCFLYVTATLLGSLAAVFIAIRIIR